MYLAGLFGFMKVKRNFIFSYVCGPSPTLTVLVFMRLSKIWTQIWSVILSDSVHDYLNVKNGISESFKRPSVSLSGI